jgi:hypothetical protein
VPDTAATATAHSAAARNQLRMLQVHVSSLRGKRSVKILKILILKTMKLREHHVLIARTTTLTLTPPLAMRRAPTRGGGAGGGAAVAVLPYARAFTPAVLGALARSTPRAPSCSPGPQIGFVFLGPSSLALSHSPRGPALEPMRGGSKGAANGVKDSTGDLAQRGAVRAPCTRALFASVVVAAALVVAGFPTVAWAAKTAASGAGSAAATAGSLIRPNDDWGLWATLIVCGAAGLRAEKTEVGAKLSSPLVTMFLALFLVNIGVLPSDAPLYAAVNKFLVPLAVPMLLLGADLRRVFRDTGSLLLAFISN